MGLQRKEEKEVKNRIVFALILFGALVMDANIYLGMLCVGTGLGVFCFAGTKKKASHTN